MFVRITRPTAVEHRVLPCGLVLDLDPSQARTLIAMGAAIAAEDKPADEAAAERVKPKREKRS